MIRHTAREQRQAAVRKLAEAVSSFVYEQSNAARNARADMIRASHLKSVKHHLAAHSAARAQRYYNAYVTVWANYADKIAARANGFGTPVTRMPDDRRGREACGATFCRVLAQVLACERTGPRSQLYSGDDLRRCEAVEALSVDDPLFHRERGCLLGCGILTPREGGHGHVRELRRSERRGQRVERGVRRNWARDC